jgi:mono/diheme cytochrome c family protein
MRTPALAILTAAVLVTGCGGSGGSGRPSLAEGARVFATSCSSCHTLQPTRGTAPPGGPLGGYRFTNAQIESFVRTMPVPRPLSDRERRAVAAFVAHAERSGAVDRPAPR